MEIENKLHSDYATGEQVFVLVDDRPQFAAKVIRQNSCNSAEYEVIDTKNRVWQVHWCYLRKTKAP